MSKEGSEKNIAEGNEKVGSKENFEQNKEECHQGNAHLNDGIEHGHGVKRIN
jgi:hypothetical protein